MITRVENSSRIQDKLKNFLLQSSYATFYSHYQKHSCKECPCGNLWTQVSPSARAWWIPTAWTQGRSHAFSWTFLWLFLNVIPYFAMGSAIFPHRSVLWLWIVPKEPSLVDSSFPWYLHCLCCISAFSSICHNLMLHWTVLLASPKRSSFRLSHLRVISAQATLTWCSPSIFSNLHSAILSKAFYFIHTATTLGLQLTSPRFICIMSSSGIVLSIRHFRVIRILFAAAS